MCEPRAPTTTSTRCSAKWPTRRSAACRWWTPATSWSASCRSATSRPRAPRTRGTWGRRWATSRRRPSPTARARRRANRSRSRSRRRPRRSPDGAAASVGRCLRECALAFVEQALRFGGAGAAERLEAHALLLVVEHEEALDLVQHRRRDVGQLLPVPIAVALGPDGQQPVIALGLAALLGSLLGRDHAEHAARHHGAG